MSLDLDNEEHRAALAWACKNHEWVPEQYIGSDRYNAHFALQNHAQAAELIRALVERAGVTCVDSFYAGRGRFIFARPSGDGMEPFVYVGSTFDKALGGNVMLRDCVAWSRIIARLLALAPNAGADAVLAALRGEG